MDKLIITNYGHAAINFESTKTPKGKDIIRINTSDIAKPFSIATIHTANPYPWESSREFLNDGGFSREIYGEMKITRSASRADDFSIDFIPAEKKDEPIDAVFNIVAVPISGNVIDIDAVSDLEHDLPIIRAFTVKCEPFTINCQKMANRRKSYVDWKFDRMLVLVIKAPEDDKFYELSVTTNNVGKNKETGGLTLTKRDFTFTIEEFRQWMEANPDSSELPTSGNFFRILFRGHEDIDEKPETFSVRTLTQPEEYKPFNGKKVAPDKGGKPFKKPFANNIRMKGDNKNNNGKKNQKKKRK